MRLHTRLRYAPAEVKVEKRADGATILRSPQTLKPFSRAVGDWLLHWYERAPDRTFIAERKGEGWRRVSYRDALSDARRVGQALLNMKLDATKPVAILSDNSVDHALLALGAMHAGIPVAPISPAYSLMSKDFGKLKYILELLQPGLIYAADGERFAPAIRAATCPGAKLVFGSNAPKDLVSTPFSDMLETNPGSNLEVAFSRLGPDTIAKILFTSGSTGTPKGVINTHRMLCANQQMLAQVWPFLEDKPQIIVDWLPWNHTFGGNFCFNVILRNGGTLYIDGGKPAPGLAEITAKNLREISPTMYFNVPRGFDLLMPMLEQDAELRRNFFRDLDMVFYAGAALPQNLWQRLEKLALAEKGGALSMISSWGSTETAPSAAAVHYPIERAGVIGLPNPGCELKLVPAAGKLEVRVKGPNVTPGYYRRDDLTREAFDEEGYYCIGDAMKFADPAVPEKGLVFDGRVAEDFKLTTGTWVHVGGIRVKLIAAGDPLIQDAVITGHDRNEIGALVFLNPAAVKDLSTEKVREKIQGALRVLAKEGGSSTYPARVLIMSEPPSIDANEITDKGYLNQRAVLERRAALVEKLYAVPASPDVIS
jgi:feruloyl-CoA synthase